MSNSNGSASPPLRPRSPIRKVEVERVDALSRLVRRITLRGEALAGFAPPRPAAHVKLHILPHEKEWPAEEAAPRPPRRTYTPRSFDPEALQLAIDFVLHGRGLASDWAETALPGQTTYVSGPGGGYDVPSDATTLVLVADDTALPAAGMILESMPKGCRALVLAEVADADERRAIAAPGDFEVRWLDRAASSAVPGELLERATAELDVTSDAYWWIASEAASMRRMRKDLAQRRGIPIARMHTRGYWKLGETAYPDHDYGND